MGGDGSWLGYFEEEHYMKNSKGGEKGVGLNQIVRRGINISDITSFTETVHVLFHTEGFEWTTGIGWRLEWSSAPAPEQQTSGVLTSPNYPEDENYPKNFDGLQRIQVPEGNTIWMKFTEFELEDEEEVFVTLTDDDGTVLSGKYEDEFSYAYIQSNIVHVHFHTDGNTQRSGWRLEWEAVVG